MMALCQRRLANLFSSYVLSSFSNPDKLALIWNLDLQVICWYIFFYIWPYTHHYAFYLLFLWFLTILVRLILVSLLHHQDFLDHLVQKLCQVPTSTTWATLLDSVSHTQFSRRYWGPQNCSESSVHQHWLWYKEPTSIDLLVRPHLSLKHRQTICFWQDQNDRIILFATHAINIDSVSSESSRNTVRQEIIKIVRLFTHWIHSLAVSAVHQYSVQL